MGLWAALWPVLLCGGQGAPHMALPPPTRYVADYADVIDASHENELNGMLQQLELTTGVQYIILTVQNLKGESLAWFAKKTAVLWKLRQDGMDKGVLFVLVAHDKTYRFEVGRDLRGILTEPVLARIGDDSLKPDLEAGKVGEGVYQGNRRVVQTIAREYGVQVSDSLQALPRYAPGSRPLTRSRSWIGWGSVLLIGLPLAAVVAWFRRRIRRSLRVSLGQTGFEVSPGYGQGGPCGGGCFGGGSGAFGAGLGGSSPAGTSGSH